MSKPNNEIHPSEPEPEPEPWECQVCGGPVISMGVLGNLEHGRCRNCGMDHSRTA